MIMQSKRQQAGGNDESTFDHLYMRFWMTIYIVFTMGIFKIFRAVFTQEAPATEPVKEMELAKQPAPKNDTPFQKPNFYGEQDQSNEAEDVELNAQKPME